MPPTVTRSRRPATQPRSPAVVQACLRHAREAIYNADAIYTESGEVRKPATAGLSSERGEALRQIIRAEHTATCVETGFAFGLSSSFILDALLNHPDNAAAAGPILTSIDPYQADGFGNAGRRHLREAGAAHLHALIEQKSEAALPRLIAENQCFDIAFLDGDHRFDSVFIDVFFALRLVRQGGLIILDDSWMPSVRRCVNYFVANGVCTCERHKEISASGRFCLLRAVAEQDARPWDHFVEF